LTASPSLHSSDASGSERLEVYLASDLHLGSPSFAGSRNRELAFTRWLEEAAAGQGHAEGHPATEFHLVGDLFDFWYEYRYVVPRGGARLMGAIARITDAGIPVHFYTGNHDLWTFGYLEEELGVRVHTSPQLFQWGSRRCLVGHGDGLGPGDRGYKRLKRLFHNPILQRMFQTIHPDWTHGFARRWSASSRESQQLGASATIRPEQEWLWVYACDYLRDIDPDMDLFFFGHRHLPLELDLITPPHRTRSLTPRYVNLGDWIQYYTYVHLNETGYALRSFR
jgi:UDP-2,3-diacylglucosamine hydrolase